MEARAPIIPLNRTRIDICHRYMAIHLTYNVTVPSSSHDDLSGNYACGERWSDSIYNRDTSNSSIQYAIRYFEIFLSRLLKDDKYENKYLKELNKKINI